MSRSPLRRLAPALLLVIGLAACASDGPDEADTPTPTATADESRDGGATTDDAADDASEAPSPSETAATDPATFPATVEHDLGEATIEEQPSRIVSLSPAATEMLFAMGAGEQVVAVDDLSTFPPEAPLVDGLSAFDPNVEAILELDPDLVVVSGDRNDTVAGLTAVGVPVLAYGAAPTLDAAYEQMRRLGDATGTSTGAAALVEDVSGRLAALADGSAGEGLTYYHELSTDLYTVTSSTFVGEVYGLFGLTSIADPADEDGSASGYPQLSTEFLVAADPDLVFLACTVFCGEDAASFAARDGLGGLTAVERGTIVELDDDVASRWGPRVVDFAEAIAAALDEVG